MESKSRIALSWILRLAASAVFFLSAVSKLAGIDHFELYIFSFGILPLNACYLVARLCIGAELVLAALLLSGYYPKLTKTVTVGLLSVFTLFLCYAALAGRKDSCQCFGQWVHMSPTVSMLKNALLVVLVLIHFRQLPPRQPRARLWLVIPAAVALIVAPFVVSVPDNWAFGPQAQRYDEQMLQQAISPGGALASQGVGTQRRVLAFVTHGCPYCKMAREKLESIVKRHHLDPHAVVYVYPSEVSPELFLGITFGMRPLVLLLDGQQVVASYHFRNIDERQVATFLQNR